MIYTSSIENPYFWQGKRWEGDLYYWQARYYSPSLGRFVSQDPQGIVDSMNLYLFVKNNPSSYVDPSGELIPLAVVAAMGLGAAGSVAFGYCLAKLESYKTGQFNYNWTDVGIDAAVGSMGAVAMFAKGANFLIKAARVTEGLALDVGVGMLADYGKQWNHEGAQSLEHFDWGSSFYGNAGGALAGMGAGYLVHSMFSNKQILGGAYEDVRKFNTGGQVHHIPADSVSLIPTKKAPSIWMEFSDHSKTASYFNISGAIGYRKQQSELLKQGKLREAIQMDIDDIRSKFGKKYNKGIKQMLKYVDRNYDNLMSYFN